MNQEQINGTDFYNFPDPETVSNSLFWMGDDYRIQVLNDFSTQFSQQDPGTTIVAIKSESEPEFSYNASAKDGTIHSVSVKFTLQFLLKSGSGQHWRLNGLCTYHGNNLHTQDSEINMNFELINAVQI